MNDTPLTKIKPWTQATSININCCDVELSQKYQPLKKNKNPRHSSPRSPISTSALLRQLQIQGRVSPSICSCAEPKKLLQKEQRNDSSSHSASRLSFLCQSCQEEPEPTTFGSLEHSSTQAGITPSPPNRGNIWWHFHCCKQGMNLSRVLCKRWRLSHPRWLLVRQSWVLLLPPLLHVNVLKKI